MKDITNEQKYWIEMWLRVTMILLTLVLIFVVMAYSDELMTNPIDYVEKHTDRTCVLNTSEYICACGKYYKTTALNFNFSNLKDAMEEQN